jgi:ferredoxin
VAVYQVRLVNSDQGLDLTVSVSDHEYILDIAEMVGIQLPSGCKQGDCSVCVVQLVEGEIDQDEKVFLRPTEVEAGYTVTCVAYPRSNCTLLTHQEQTLYRSGASQSCKSHVENCPLRVVF